MIPTYCIAHRDPLIGAHLYDAVILTHPREDHKLFVSVVAHPVMLNVAPTEGLVAMCGYRKIVATRPQDKSHDVMTVAAHGKIIGREHIEPRPGFDFLLCRHDFFKIGGKHRNVFDQWKACHHEIDIVDGFDIAVEMGAFTEQERLALEAEPALIEGGCSMGVFPAKFLRETMAITWPIYREFIERHGDRVLKYTPAQRRCVAFMAERLETHFILRELRRLYGDPLPNELFGCLTCAWDGPWKQGIIQ